MATPLEQIYKQRTNFCIVALTGVSGSGCSALAQLMASDFHEWELLRKPDKIHASSKNTDKQNVLFLRKYKLCWDYCEKHYDNFKFTVLQYRDVLLFALILSIIKDIEEEARVRSIFVEQLRMKFDKGHENGDEKESDYTVNNIFSEDDIKKLGLSDSSVKAFREIPTIDENKEKYREAVYELFVENDEFKNFANLLYDEMRNRDYYAKNFFVHRLGNALRATGNPLETIHVDDYYSNEYVFSVVELISDIIKGGKDKGNRRFVIDSIRNSMEILYLRERFSAFYPIAVHNESYEDDAIKSKLTKYLSDNPQQLEKLQKKIINLNRAEEDKGDFEKAKLWSPDISRCVTECEIHIKYRKNPAHEENNEEACEYKEMSKRELNSFYTYSEQWLKFAALIMRPGLITPSRDERCMSIAYIAKFNSGCISRQVGCTIVNDKYAVQSIGWNDPPSGQLPCSLRFAPELCGDEALFPNDDFSIYSKFEREDKKTYNVKDKEGNTILTGDGFKGCLSKEITPHIDLIRDEGLSYPYCFRSRYNKYCGQKDMVNTRSLHAEENTMLRISQSGGLGLNGGTMYVTAAPCVLCSKKAFQIGIKAIVYLDPYTDIATDFILRCGFSQPRIKVFIGAIGATYNKLYRPFMPYKDELKIIEDNNNHEKN